MMNSVGVRCDLLCRLLLSWICRCCGLFGLGLILILVSCRCGLKCLIVVCILCVSWCWFLVCRCCMVV